MLLASQNPEARTLAQRNRRTALALVGWIVFLVGVSVLVVWVRN